MKIKRGKPKPAKYKLTLNETEYFELRYYTYIVANWPKDYVPTEAERKFATELYDGMNNVQS